MIALSALAAAGAVRAETSPFSIGAGLAVATDDNLFRAPPGETVSDRYTTLSVFGGFDQMISRQHLQAS